MLALRLRAATARRVREHNDRIEHAWITARLNAYAPTKSTEFVKLAAILEKGRADATPSQSPQQQLAMARAWAASRQR
jgi:hypothetical protein